MYIFSYMIFGGRSRRKPHFGWAVPGIDWALCRSVLGRELFRHAGILSLCHDEPPVEALELEQLLVGAAFHEMTLVEYDQTVRVAQCGQTVCNGERGAVLCQLVDRVLDQLFRLCVECGGCFIEDQDLRIVDQRTCNGDTLPFTAEREYPFSPTMVL